jgi:hypothetical protein
MDLVAIPNQDQVLPEMLMNTLEEAGHVGAVDVARSQIPVHADVAVPWCQRQDANRRQPVVPVPGMLDWGVTSRRPGSLPAGSQYKATFIEKNDASLLSQPLFLSATNLGRASDRSPLRCVPAHAARASDTSSREHAAGATHDQHDTERRRNTRSLRTPEGRSTARCRTPPPQVPAEGFPTTACDPFRRGTLRARARAWVATQPAHLPPGRPSTASPKKTTHRQVLRLLEFHFPATTTVPQSAAGLQVRPQFLSVS